MRRPTTIPPVSVRDKKPVALIVVRPVADAKAPTPRLGNRTKATKGSRGR